MSDGITDAHRENRFKLNFVPKTPPTRCKGCVFITCSPPDAQWECINPIDTELLDKDNTCIYHLPAGELAEYCRRRLMTKLKGGSQGSEDRVNRPRCKWLHTDVGLYCSNPSIKHRMKIKNIDFCSECVGYEPQDVSDMLKDKELQCKHLLDNFYCAKIGYFQCPFVGMRDAAVTLCKEYEANLRYEVHVLGNSTSIIGVFKTREQAEQFIRDNVKVVEMTV